MIVVSRFTTAAAVLVALGATLASTCALAASDDDSSLAVATVAEGAGGAGLGVATRFERSPYRGGGTRNDLVPIYVYEGKHVFLESYRLGVKLNETPATRLDILFAYRFEGYPYDRIPSSLGGMVTRNTGADIGLAYRYKQPWGTLFGELLHDVASGSDGTEMRLGYRYDLTIGKLRLQPLLAIAARDARLNNYYYGVRTAEATLARPAFEPGGGVNGEIGVTAAYLLSERWRLLAGLSATRWSAGVRASPIVENRTQLAGSLGLAYDFSPAHEAWPSGRPLIVKVLHGKSTDCDVARVMRLSCFSTQTADNTSVTAIELGRPFIERLNGWPLDFVGYVGVLRHEENGWQNNSWQVNADMKAYYYGFPWRERVRTRLGFGVGVSYAQRVPFVELRDQITRERGTSRLLNYLDPSVDVSLGDLIGAPSMRETYLGLGVSHRSGIFGTSRLLGNVNGGSNYIYSYLEWRI